MVMFCLQDAMGDPADKLLATKDMAVFTSGAFCVCNAITFAVFTLFCRSQKDTLKLKKAYL